MTSDERALLRAVCAAPDDDVPRLVYADWLDEHDRPERAEFIRAQCELATLTEDSPHRRQLAFRCRELLDANAKDWTEQNRLQTHQCRFRRGFIEAVELTAADLNKYSTRYFELSPIRRVQLRELGGKVDSLQWIPTQNSIVALELIGSDLETDAVRELAGFKRFAQVRELSLPFNTLGDDALPILSDRAFSSQLARLNLGANPFTETGRDRLRTYFGERVTFDYDRDKDYLYTIQDDDFQTGRGKGHTQLFVTGGGLQLCLAVFDYSGNLLTTEVREVTIGSPEGRLQFHEWIRGEWEFRSATIRVKRFKFSDGMGIEDYAPGWVRVFNNPESDEQGAAQVWLGRWLANGKFRWTWGTTDWWLNRDGVVTDT